MTDDTDFRPKARRPRGLQDRRGAEVAAERALISRVVAVYERFGFEALETPAFEYADALGKFLPDADRPNEGVFALQDDDEQWIALRYDHTAPLARFVAEQGQSLGKPFRRFAFGPVFRNEKPGPGRFREFMQCDADTVGSARPEADAEMVAMAVEGLEAAGLPAGAALLKINNRKLLNGVLERAGVRDDGQRLKVLRAVDKLDRLGAEGVLQLLGPGRRDESGDFTAGAGLDAGGAEAVIAFTRAGRETRSDTLRALADVVGSSADGEAGLLELEAVDRALSGMGVDGARAVFDPSVVRGLEYYTGPVFEAELRLEINDEKGRRVQFGSIGGGGRYDELISRFTGERTPATGFSFGVSRLAAALRAAGRLPAQSRGPVVVVVFDRDRMDAYFACAKLLRDAGVAAEVYLGEAGLKAQMKYADRRLSPAVVLLGDDELSSGTATVKDLDLGRDLAKRVDDHAAWRADRPGQATVPMPELVGHLKKILSGA